MVKHEPGTADNRDDSGRCVCGYCEHFDRRIRGCARWVQSSLPMRMACAFGVRRSQLVARPKEVVHTSAAVLDCDAAARQEAEDSRRARETTMNLGREPSPMAKVVRNDGVKFAGWIASNVLGLSVRLPKAIGCRASRSRWGVDPGPEERSKINCGVRLGCRHPFLERAASRILSPVPCQLEECLVSDDVT